MRLRTASKANYGLIIIHTDETCDEAAAELSAVMLQAKISRRWIV